MALRISVIAFVRVFRIRQGSAIVETDILLPANTTQNATTLRDSLVNDIVQNSTGQLYPYFVNGTSSDQINAILGINRKLDTFVFEIECIFFILPSNPIHV